MLSVHRTNCTSGEIQHMRWRRFAWVRRCLETNASSIPRWRHLALTDSTFLCSCCCCCCCTLTQ